MKTKLLAICLLLILVAALFVGCGDANNSGSATSDTATEATEKAEDIVIKTKYVDLHYPLLWEDRFSYEVSEEDPYTVTCFATVDEHKPIEIFSIVFDGDKGDIVGTIDGTTIGLVLSQPKYDKTWSEGQRSAIVAMQEDINYILDKLNETDGYTEE